MHELHWVFNSDDMAPPRPVDAINHGCQRGRFPRSRWPGDEQQPVFFPAQRREYGWCSQGLQGSDGARDNAEDRSKAVQMAEGIDPEACQAGHFIGKVEAIVGLEAALRLVCHGFGEECRGLVSAQLAVFDGNEVSIQADPWWLARQEMEVRAFLIDHKFEKSVDAFHVPSLTCSRDPQLLVLMPPPD